MRSDAGREAIARPELRQSRKVVAVAVGGRPFATDERKKSDWPISAIESKPAKTSLFCRVDVVLSRITCVCGSTCGNLSAGPTKKVRG